MGNMGADFKKILFATDMSEISRFASSYACSIGDKFDAQVWAIHVVPDILEEYSLEAGMNLSSMVTEKDKESFRDSAVHDAQIKLQERVRQISQDVVTHISHKSVSEKHIIIKVGDPVKEITREAEENNFDLLVIGTRGYNELEDLFVGNTAKGVIMHSKIPVLVAQP